MKEMYKNSLVKNGIGGLGIAMLVVAIVVSCAGETTTDYTVRSELLLQETETWVGQPIEYPEGSPQVSLVEIEIAPGEITGWHYHPMPSVGYLLQGTLEVTARESGDVIQFQKGEAVAEMVGDVHRGQNVGDEPVRLLVFYAGSDELELTHQAP